MILFPLLGAVGYATGTTLEKISLMKKRIHIADYQTAVSIAIVLLCLPLLYFFWGIYPGAFTPINLILLGVIMLISVIANLLIFYSEKGEEISKLEPTKIVEPIFVVILAVIMSFFIDHGLYERDLGVIIPALIAGGALLFANLKKDKLAMNKYVIAGVLGSLLFATELIISQIILQFYSPITFYFFRAVGMTLFTIFIFRPKRMGFFTKKDAKILFATAFMWIIYRVSVYYGYITLGIISTTIITMLAPVLVYLFARIFLKEKLTWKNIVASIVILLCVIYIGLK